MALITTLPPPQGQRLFKNINYPGLTQGINTIKIGLQHSRFYSSKTFNDDFNNSVIVNLPSKLNSGLLPSMDNDKISFKTWLITNNPARVYLNSPQDFIKIIIKYKALIKHGHDNF